MKTSDCAFIGSMDEGVTEGLQSIQGTPNTTGHMEEDERYSCFSGSQCFSKVSFYNVALLQFSLKKQKQTLDVYNFSSFSVSIIYLFISRGGLCSVVVAIRLWQDLLPKDQKLVG